MRSSTLSGRPGNSGSRPRPYARISGSATLKPSIQPGNGCAIADSMMAGRTDRQAAAGSGPQLLGGALRERLGERVDVGPAEALGAGAAGVDERGGDPLDAGLLARAGHRLGALLAVLGAGAVHERTELVGLAREHLDTFAGRLRGRVLGAPVDLVAEPGLRHDALAEPADVAGGDVHDVRRRSGCAQRLVQSDRAADVGVEGLVDGRVERHGRGGVDDDVDVAGQRREPSRARPRRCGSGRGRPPRRPRRRHPRASCGTPACAAGCAAGRRRPPSPWCARAARSWCPDARRAAARARPVRRIRCRR